jgi:hypothetical protein
VESSSNQDFAAMVGGGTVCATAAVIDNRVAAIAVRIFFME